MNFDGGASIPTFSIADIHACVAAGNEDFLKQHFGGKVVLLGVVLDVEDLKLTAKRFITAPEGDNIGTRCVLPPPDELYRIAHARDSIPGVYIHVAPINNLLRGDALRLPERIWNSLITIAFAFAAAGLAMRFHAVSAGVAILCGGFFLAVGGHRYFPVRIGAAAFRPDDCRRAHLFILLGYRFAISDKDKRRLRHAFALYLAPPLVDRW